MNKNPAPILSLSNEPVTFERAGFFSKIVLDYLSEDTQLKPFYGRSFRSASFAEQMDEKQKSYQHRETLVEALQDQYRQGKVKPPSGVELLRRDNTFTITTGHQVSLFTGPAYFIWKILSVVSTARGLKEAYPENEFIPMFWMATEDHDFEEANHFIVNGKKLEWESGQGGAVGRMTPTGLDEVAAELEEQLGLGYHSGELLKLFKKAYLSHENIANATRFLVDELFKDFGVVTIDGDDARLKSAMIPSFERELLEQVSHRSVSQTNEALGAVYDLQVQPREINLFYLDDHLRERIVKDVDNRFSVVHTDKTWSQEGLIRELQEHPERFSPNVILRPLYQEMILPNLAYCGGGGELAYWFQLKAMFEQFHIPFPILILRQSVVVVNAQANAMRVKFKLKIEDLFDERNELLNRVISEHSATSLDLAKYRPALEDIFLKIDKHIRQIDEKLEQSVRSSYARAGRVLDSLESKMLRAEKRKQAELLNKFDVMMDGIFPQGNLQERHINFADIYLNLGSEMMDQVLRQFERFESKFNVLLVSE